MSLTKEQQMTKSLFEIGLSNIKDLEKAKKEHTKMVNNIYKLYQAGIIKVNVHDAIVYYPNRIDDILSEHKSKKESKSEVS